MNETKTKQTTLQEDIDSQIFVRGHYTDFEKLLFANNEIKDLKKTIKRLQSEEENQKIIKSLQVEIGKLKSHIDELNYSISQLRKIKKAKEIKAEKEVEEIMSKEEVSNRYLKKYGDIEKIAKNKIGEWETKYGLLELKYNKLLAEHEKQKQ